MKKIFISIALLLAVPSLMQAEGDPVPDQRNKGLIIISPKYNGDIDLITIIKQRNNLHFQDAQPSRFLFVDTKKKIALGVGGMARTVLGSEFGGIINTTTDQGFSPASIATPPGLYPKSQFRLSAATSQIYFKLVGQTEKLGNIEAFISTNFQGTNYTPMLRQAYVSFLGFTIGQAWSTFTDLSAIPNTVDFAGPNGMVILRNPMLRYGRYFANRRMNFALAAEFPNLNATYSPSTKWQPQSVPDIIGYLQFNWDEGESHVRVSSILRNMSYRDTEDNKSRMNQGWGVQVTGVSYLNKKLQLFYQFVYGKGIGSYLNDISLLSRDLVPDIYHQGNLQALPMWGVTGGLQYNINKKVFASTAFSQSRMYSKNGYDPKGMYKWGIYIVANTFWNVTENCQLGIEYLRGIKTMHGDGSVHANRINLMAQYSF